MKYNNGIGLLLALASLGWLAEADGQKMYKWVDEDGNVHFSDKVPPDQLERARERLNDQGVVIESVDRAKTEEEYAAELEARRALARAAEEAERQREADEKVLATYASERDIERIKEQEVAALDRNIAAAQAYISAQTRALSELLERAAAQESRGTAVAPILTERIDDVREQIREREAYIGKIELQRGQILEQFERELAHYREVKRRRSEG